MDDSEADRVGRTGALGADAARLRAEAVAMLSEQAALCSAPPPDAAPQPRPAAAALPAPATPPGLLPRGGADTAALLRELTSLGADAPLPTSPAPSPTPVEPSAPRRTGLFGRRGRDSR